MNRAVKVGIIGALAVLLLAAGFGVFRAMVYMGMEDPFYASRPTMADLLDGRAADPERLAAIEAVKARVARVEVDGTRRIGTRVMTSCDEGQNNWKVHDGYRLRCEAVAGVQLAWKGDYRTGLAAVTMATLQRCDGPTESDTDSAPGPGPDNYRRLGLFNCGSDGEMWGYSARADALNPDSARFFACVGSRYGRCIESPSGIEIDQALRGTDWVVVLQTRAVYYQDQA